MQNINFLQHSNRYNLLETWTNQLQAQGKHAFALHQLRTAFPSQSEIALKSALKRLSDKKSILSIHKGYYLIIPPSYSSKGMLPPTMFLDAFMKELNRPYYLALLNAAAMHGASHQQPQEFFVVTNFPVLRPMRKKGLKVNYISKKEIPSTLIDTRKTEAGYLQISNAVLTAIDLIQYSKRVGGLNRVVAVLAELSDSIEPMSFDDNLIRHAPVTSLQRLGYLLDMVLDRKELAAALHNSLLSREIALFRIPLKAAAPAKGYETDEKWKVIKNITIEYEE